MSIKLNNMSTMIIMYDYDDLHLIITSIQFANKWKSLTSIENRHLSKALFVYGRSAVKDRTPFSPILFQETPFLDFFL